MSMLCDQLHAFAEGELDQVRALKMRDHLAGCSACQQELHELVQLMAVEDELSPAEPMGEAGQGRAPAPDITSTSARDRISATGVDTGSGSAPSPGSGSGARDGTLVDLGAYRARRLRRVMSVAVPLVVVAAAAVVVLAVYRRPSPATRRPDPSQLLASLLGPTRAMEGRVSYPGADGYRPYDIPRGTAQPPVETIPLALMAEMEARGDVHGVAVARLLGGDVRRAELELERTADSAATLSDRALAALLGGDAGRALTLLDAALALAPRHAQALWNRGLALEASSLWLEAARAFDMVAELGEPGWSEEARTRAARLRQMLEERKGGWYRALESGARMVQSGVIPPAGTIESHPGLMRLYFYDAVRAAHSRERLGALRAVAQKLDAHDGGTTLGTYLDRVAGADMGRRGPLAATYAGLAAGRRLDPDAARAFIEQARRAGADDIVMGALVLTGSPPGRVADRDLDELTRLAGRSGDPWFVLLALEQTARALLEQGRPRDAELALLAITEQCRSRPIDYRCGRLYDLLTVSYLEQHRVSDATASIARALAHLRRCNDWSTEQRVVLHFVNIAYLRDDVSVSGFAVAQAHLSEYLLRIDGDQASPGYCPNWFYVHEALAQLYINLQDLEAARAVMARADQRTGMRGDPGGNDDPGSLCPEPPMTLPRAFVLAHLLRSAGDPAQVAVLGAELDSMAGTADRPLALHIHGRLLIEREPERGRALLRQAIDAAEQQGRDDSNAAKARAYSYSVLIQDAGARGNHAGILSLIGEEASVTMAERCVLAVAAEEAVLVVARGPDGAVVAERRLRPPRDQLAATAVVSRSIQDRLRACDVIDVFARSPFIGTAGLLPPELAWRYRAAGHETAQPSAPRRVVVSDVQAPPDLGMPPLAPHPVVTGADVHLRGPEATPRRVLAAMADATDIEIHAHGLVNPGVSDAAFLALSPDAGGQYALTAEMLRSQPLRGAPRVILGACHGAYAPDHVHGSSSLASTLIAGGARTVIASPAPIQDVDAPRFFAGVQQRMARGIAAAAALRDERTSYREPRQRAWMDAVVVFE